MTKFNQLIVTKNKPKKRKGRGVSAGQGKTAGRGTKGQKSRSGAKIRPFFEGGQTPLVRKLPKLAGFKSHRPKTTNIYIGQLDDLKTNSKVIDNHSLYQAGLIEDAFSTVKLINTGSVKQAHQVELQRASKSARLALEQAGGSFKVISRRKDQLQLKN